MPVINFSHPVHIFFFKSLTWQLHMIFFLHGFPCQPFFQACVNSSRQTFSLIVDGKYTEWSQWSECTATCGGGTQTRHRSCTNPPPQNGGKSCLDQGLGPEIETQSCNVQPCPSKLHCCWNFIERFHSSGTQLCDKRKRLHTKRVQLPQDSFLTSTWPPFHWLGTPIWPPWRHVCEKGI